MNFAILLPELRIFNTQQLEEPESQSTRTLKLDILVTLGRTYIVALKSPMKSQSHVQSAKLQLSYIAM